MKRILAASCCLALFACGGPSEDQKKAADLALKAPLSANNPQGKTLGECLDANGYGTTKKELIDSAQRRTLDGGGDVYRVSYYNEDTGKFLRVGVVVTDKAVGGWEYGDTAKLEAFGCIIDGAHRLDLS